MSLKGSWPCQIAWLYMLSRFSLPSMTYKMLLISIIQRQKLMHFNWYNTFAKTYYFGVLQSKNFGFTSKVTSAIFVSGNFIFTWNSKIQDFKIYLFLKASCKNFLIFTWQLIQLHEFLYKHRQTILWIYLLIRLLVESLWGLRNRYNRSFT